MSQDDATSQSKQREPLHPLWRAGLGLIGGFFVFASLALYGSPPEWKTHTVENDGKTKTETVQSDPAVYCLSLLGLGVVLLCVAANGRRLSEISSTGAHFDEPTAEELKGLAEGAVEVPEVTDIERPLPAPKSRRIIKVNGKAVELFDSPMIPMQVMKRAAEASPKLVLRPEDVEFAFRESGPGDHPWYVKPKGGSALRIMFAGQGQKHETIQDNLRTGGRSNANQ